MARTRRPYVRQMPKIYGNLQKPTRSYEWIGRFLTRSLWSAAFIASVYALFFSGWFTIKKVEVEGARFSSEEAIRTEVGTEGSIWLLPKDEIRSHILRERSVESVAVFRGIPDSIKVVVKERQPAVLLDFRPHGGRLGR